MNVLTQLKKLGKVAVDAAKWPFVERTIFRAADSVVDAAEQTRLEVEAKIIDLRQELVNIETGEGAEAKAREIIKKIAEQKLKLEAAEKVAEIAKGEREYLNSKAADLADEEK